jgi:hypothetical protein
MIPTIAGYRFASEEDFPNNPVPRFITRQIATHPDEVPQRKYEVNPDYIYAKYEAIWCDYLGQFVLGTRTTPPIK